MVVRLMRGFKNENFTAKAQENAVKEAASGLESVEKLIKLISESQSHQHQRHSSFSMETAMDCRAVADVAVSKFNKVISLLATPTRIGHARFRRAPLLNQNSQMKQLSEPKTYDATPLHQIPPPALHQRQIHSDLPSLTPKNEINETKESSKTINFSYSSAANSFMSSLTGDNDIKQQPSSPSAEAFQITNLYSHVSSSGKPPLSNSSSLKRKCSSENNLGSSKCGSSSGRCHCSKKSRKMRLKRVVRVPAISLKMADIPPDDYSWRKYGQKPIKGSPHPRGYYKCSSVRGCPARKHVERALDDPSMLVVTYEDDHNHSLPVSDATNLILESC